MATIAASPLASTGASSRNRLAPCGVIIIDSHTLDPAATSHTLRGSGVAAAIASGQITYHGWTTGPSMTIASSASHSARIGPSRPARSHSQSTTPAVAIWPPIRQAEIIGSSEVM